MKPLFAEIFDRFTALLSKSPSMANLLMVFILFNLKIIIRIQGILHYEFKNRLKEKDFTAQIKTRDNRVGRYTANSISDLSGKVNEIVVAALNGLG